MAEIRGFGVDYNETKLVNGVKLYSFYKPNSPIYFRAFFYAGSQFDGDKPGLAHFCEHILLSGTEKYPIKESLNEKVEEIGARKNAFTNKKYLWLTVDLADKADTTEMFDIVDQILNKSIFSPDTIEMERKAVQAEQTRTASNPSRCIYELQSSLLFQGTNMENPVLGSDNSLTSISRQDLLNFNEKYIKNGQVAYFISGDFDKKTVINFLNKINGSRIKIDDKVIEILTNTKQKQKIKEIPGTEQNYISLSTRFEPMLIKNDQVAVDIFNVIFGQNNTSRLITSLRNKKGLVYDAWSEIYANAEFATLSIITNCRVANSKDVISIIKQEFSKILETGIYTQELDRAKKSILRNIKFWAESSSFWLSSYAMMEQTSYSNPVLHHEYSDILESLTLEDVNSFIKKYFTGKELLLTGIGDFNFLNK